MKIAATKRDRKMRSELEKLRVGDNYRRLRRLRSAGPKAALIDGRETDLFCDNDYLGLSSHPKVLEAAHRALERFGSSGQASRLISGNNELYEALESRLAALKGKERALVFPSGYLANLGLLSSLAGPGDEIFMDRLNHASLYDGCRLSGASARRYRHADSAELADMLSKTESNEPIIVTDGVFSMDGDLAPLARLRELTSKYGATLVIDDAHGTGVLGINGGGAGEYLGVDADIEIGTLSKALGALGGFVAGSADLIDFLINKCRPLIFTTALPPSVLGAATAALEVMREERWRRERVMSLAARARSFLIDAGLPVSAGITPIIPIVVGESSTALQLSELCLQQGVFIPAVRPPAVPPREARLRMTVSAAHTDDQLDHALHVLRAVAPKVGLG